MKIINEKGMLFGKINIIDFLVVVFLVSLVPMFINAIKLSKIRAKEQLKRVENAEKKFIYIDLNCLFTKLTPKVANSISIGDSETDSEGKVIALVSKIGEFSPLVYEFDIGLNGKLIKRDQVLKQIPVTLSIKVETRGNKLYYKDAQVLNNTAFDFISSKYKAEAVFVLDDKLTPKPTD